MPYGVQYCGTIDKTFAVYVKCIDNSCIDKLEVDLLKSHFYSVVLI